MSPFVSDDLVPSTREQAAKQEQVPQESRKHEKEKERSDRSPKLGQKLIGEQQRDNDKKVEDTKQNFLKA